MEKYFGCLFFSLHIFFNAKKIAQLSGSLAFHLSYILLNKSKPGLKYFQIYLFKSQNTLL